MISTLDRVEAYALVEALHSEAARKMRESRKRSLAGERNNDVRRVLRNNAQYNRELAQRIAREHRFT